MRLDLRGLAGEYLTTLMEWELTIHLGQFKNQLLNASDRVTA
jgi:hypothetical protein